MSTERSRAPVGVPTLLVWRRTGLVLYMAALVCFAGFIAAIVARGLGTIAAVLGVIAFACALIGLGFCAGLGRTRM